ncbi:MAG: hypothetical protein FWH02_04395 [Oscillospiraceae bacterium]|nr:hypothetical protein [Oscillospiraceae bacterium]
MKIIIAAICAALLLLCASCSAPVSNGAEDAAPPETGQNPAAVDDLPPPAQNPDPAPGQNADPAPAVNPQDDPPPPAPSEMPEWARLYRDYLSQYDLITYTNFHEGPGSVGIGYRDGEMIWISVGVQFRDMPGYDYPIMVSGKFGENYANFLDCWYFVEDGALVMEYAFAWEEIPEGYEHLYEMKDFDGYNWPAPKGEQIAEFAFRGDDSKYDTADLVEAIQWLEGQE